MYIYIYMLYHGTLSTHYTYVAWVMLINILLFFSIYIYIYIYGMCFTLCKYFVIDSACSLVYQIRNAHSFTSSSTPLPSSSQRLVFLFYALCMSCFIFISNFEIQSRFGRFDIGRYSLKESTVRGSGQSPWKWSSQPYGTHRRPTNQNRKTRVNGPSPTWSKGENHVWAVVWWMKQVLLVYPRARQYVWLCKALYSKFVISTLHEHICRHTNISNYHAWYIHVSLLANTFKIAHKHFSLFTTVMQYIVWYVLYVWVQYRGTMIRVKFTVPQRRLECSSFAVIGFDRAVLSLWNIFSSKECANIYIYIYMHILIITIMIILIIMILLLLLLLLLLLILTILNMI